MKRKGFRIIGLVMLGLFLFSGCASKEEKLASTLTEGTGQWTFVTNEGEGKLVFFEDGTSNALDGKKEYEAAYKINKEGTELKLSVVDSDAFTTIKNVVIESKTVIKGDLSKNGKSDSTPVKLVKQTE